MAIGRILSTQQRYRAVLLLAYRGHDVLAGRLVHSSLHRAIRAVSFLGQRRHLNSLNPSALLAGYLPHALPGDDSDRCRQFGFMTTAVTFTAPRLVGGRFSQAPAKVL